ncbi:MAG TPA: hypothetical protein VNE39_29060 [Planctomycetota bacterium]|nr:hypothetical protein [Planctomycetota bacterium]
MDVTIGVALCLSAMLCSAGLAGEAGEAAPEKLPATAGMPILAWGSIDAAHTSVERFRELADAGFNQHFTYSYASAEELAKALDAASRAGVKVHAFYKDMLKDIPATVARFKEHPALAAWHLRDEPSARDFAQLAECIRQFAAADKNPDHFCYINLFPNYASTGPNGQLGTASYREHIERFVKEVPVKVISFDHYPITGNRLRAQWYENLEIIAKAARDAGKPFWAFALSVAHYSYPVPTLAHLRLEVYSDLAYGAQGIQYFTYWAPKGAEWGLAPVANDGRRTAVYDLVKEMNRELRGLSGVFVGSRVLSVGHTGKPPAGTAAYAPAAPITALRTEGEGAVVSLLARDARRFLVIVNRDFNKPMPLQVAWQESAAVAAVAKDGTLTRLSARKREATIQPGDVEILSWVVQP